MVIIFVLYLLMIFVLLNLIVQVLLYLKDVKERVSLKVSLRRQVRPQELGVKFSGAAKVRSTST